jgi:hypothetical protein
LADFKTADVIHLGVEQKLKRRCSLDHTKSERFVALAVEFGESYRSAAQFLNIYSSTVRFNGFFSRCLTD